MKHLGFGLCARDEEHLGFGLLSKSPQASPKPVDNKGNTMNSYDVECLLRRITALESIAHPPAIIPLGEIEARIQMLENEVDYLKRKMRNENES